mgnify:CR=1 FL=1
MVPWYIVILLLMYCTFRDLNWQKERKDLYNRIMCKDISEYQDNLTKRVPRKYPESAHKRALRQWRSTKGGGE